MTDDDCGEIEYLDEDEEIVQNYVHTGAAPIPENTATDEDIEGKITPLLVERIIKKKQKTEEEDSDYDPNQDGGFDYEFDPRQRKRKRTPARKSQKPVVQIQIAPQRNQNVSFTAKKPMDTSEKTSKTPSPATKPTEVPVNEWLKRKRMDIQIPDYEDALCLPVRAVKLDDNDMLRLRQWNNLCLDYIRKGESVLKTECGETKASTRTVVLRNTMNKKTGKIDTNIWSKTQVENEKGEKKSEIYQSILPRYREKRLLPSYNLAKSPQKGLRHTFEVVLTKEDNKGEDVLVAYNSKDAVSAVYKFIGKNNSEDIELGEEPEARCSGALREVATCRVCAPCYQLSWRGIRKADNGSNIPCAVCARTFVSVYNLLTHLKAHHSHADVRARAPDISATLATVVGYHYICRICQKTFDSIVRLRKHVVKHQGTEVFKCEVGNHMAS